MVFFFKQKTAYEITVWLEFRRVLFRSDQRQSRVSHYIQYCIASCARLMLPGLFLTADWCMAMKSFFPFNYSWKHQMYLSEQLPEILCLWGYITHWTDKDDNSQRYDLCTQKWMSKRQWSLCTLVWGSTSWIPMFLLSYARWLSAWSVDIERQWLWLQWCQWMCGPDVSWRARSIASKVY